MQLDQAISAIDADDWQRAFSSLAALWTASRDPELARLVDRLDAHCAAGVSPLEGQRSALQVAWENRFATGREIELSSLLAVLPNGTSKALRVRMDRLRERPPDPRVTHGLRRVAEQFDRSSTGARPAWTAFFRLVAHTGDPRLRPALQAMSDASLAVLNASPNPEWEEFDAYRMAQSDQAIARLATPTSAPDLSALRAAIDRAVARPFADRSPDRGATLDAITAQLLETPDDMGVLAVWLDALIEAGDPRADHVQLALTRRERPLKKTERAAERKLVKAQRATWLGPIAVAVDPRRCRFRRGLLEVAQTKPRRLKGAVVERPEWRSVEQIHTPVSHLLHPQLFSVRRLGTRLLPDSEAVRGPVGFRWDADGASYGVQDIEALTARVWPHITHLEVAVPGRPEQVDALARAFPALHTVLLEGSVSGRPAAAVWAWLRSIETVVLENLTGRDGREDVRWLERLPKSDVHFVFGGDALYRSFLRGTPRRRLVLSEANSTGLMTDWIRERPDSFARWYDQRLAWIDRLPELESVTVRTRSTWHAEDVDALASRLARFDAVTLPRRKRKK